MTDREKLIELIKSVYVNIPPQIYRAVVDDTAAAVIADHLIANGVTVQKRGEWIFCSSHGEDEFEQKCSVCGDYANMRYSFCPNCGAYMSHKEMGNV